MYVKNCEDFLELIKSSTNGTNSNNLEEQLMNQSLLNEIETLFEVIQSAKRNNVSKNALSNKKFCDAIVIWLTLSKLKMNNDLSYIQSIHEILSRLDERTSKVEAMIENQSKIYAQTDDMELSSAEK